MCKALWGGLCGLEGQILGDRRQFLQLLHGGPGQSTGKT